MKDRLPVSLLLVLAMVFWSISYIWSKIVFTQYSPITTIFLRLILASLIFLTIGLATGKLQRLKPRDLKFMLTLAFFQPFLYFLGENLGLYHLTPTIVAIIVSTIPLFVSFAESRFFNCPLSPMQYLGVLVSIIGVFLVLYKPGPTRSDVHWVGILFLLMAIGAAVAYSVIIVKKTEPYNPFTLITYQNLFGILYFLPLFLVLDCKEFLRTQPTVSVLLALLGLAIFSSSLAFIFFVVGLKKVGMTRASVFGNLIPPFTAGFSFFILGENLSILNISGIFLVMAGVFITQRRATGIGSPAGG